MCTCMRLQCAWTREMNKIISGGMRDGEVMKEVSKSGLDVIRESGIGIMCNCDQTEISIFLCRNIIILIHGSYIRVWKKYV